MKILFQEAKEEAAVQFQKIANAYEVGSQGMTLNWSEYTWCISIISSNERTIGLPVLFAVFGRGE